MEHAWDFFKPAGIYPVVRGLNGHVIRALEAYEDFVCVIRAMVRVENEGSVTRFQGTLPQGMGQGPRVQY